MNLSANIREAQTQSATRADTTMTWRGTASYNLSIPQESIRVRLFPNYFWFYSPRTFNNSGSIRGESGRRWDWSSLDDEWRPRVNQGRGVRVLETTNEVGYDIFTDMNANWRLTSRRDLMNEHFLHSVNIGTEPSEHRMSDTPITQFIYVILLPLNFQ